MSTDPTLWVVTELRLSLPEPPREGEPHPETVPIGPFASRRDADDWAFAYVRQFGGNGSWGVAPLRTPPTTPHADDIEHVLVGDLGRQECTCGWKPPLGQIVHRAFDRHLVATRVTPPATPHAETGDDEWEPAFCRRCGWINCECPATPHADDRNEADA